MKKLAVNILFVAGVLMVSCNDTDTTSTTSDSSDMQTDSMTTTADRLTDDDKSFVMAAADGGMMEVKLGELALKNGSSAKVKEFSRMMVEDHGKANAELKALAMSKNLSVPDSLSDARRNKYNDLGKKKGGDFDRAYAEFMVEDHKKDIDAFKKEADGGSDAELKAWASGKISTLEHHLQMADSVHNMVKKK